MARSLLTCVALSLILGLSLVACGGGGSSNRAAQAGVTSTAPANTNTGGGGATGGTGATGSSSTGGTGGATGGGGAGGLPAIFPANNPWNMDISSLPVHSNSANFVASIGAGVGLHPDFGTTYQGAPNGIPFDVVDASQPRVPITFVAYGSESDPGPYPVPPTAGIEGGPGGTGDRHVLVIDRDNGVLYELYRAFPDGNGGWNADSGAIFDLASNAQRPLGWTSADAAGLPVFPGLVRYEEAVLNGAIEHALRFTVSRSQRGFVDPARHFASSSTDPNRPPMGLRLRLKQSVDLSGFPAEVRVILQALKTYGMIVADNGSDWFLSGAPDPRWSDSNLATMRQIVGSDFEVVDTGPIVTQVP
jgi:hypothetical protein